MGLSPSKHGIARSPQPLRNGYSKRVKVENFLYVLRSSAPCRVQRSQCYTTSWGRSCCKKTTVLPPFLPGGKMSQILAQISNAIVIGPLYS